MRGAIRADGRTGGRTGVYEFGESVVERFNDSACSTNGIFGNGREPIEPRRLQAALDGNELKIAWSDLTFRLESANLILGNCTLFSLPEQQHP